MRAARVLVAGALDDRQAALVEDLVQAGQLRVQAQRLPARSLPTCRTFAGRNRERRPTAVVEGVGVRHEQAQAVVPAREVEHDEVAARRALRPREIGEKLRRGEADRERRNAALEECASRDHRNWYSADPRMRCASPDVFVCICASEPVHARAGARVREQVVVDGAARRPACVSRDSM